MKKVMHKRIFAFTLAEVLITLGIIGIVSAMTIPILMQNIQDKQFKEAAKEAFSKASQAIQLMKTDEGEDLSVYDTNPDTFKSHFVKYFKITQDCGASRSANLCVTATNTSGIYKTLHGDNAATWRMHFGQFITTDGMFWGIGGDGKITMVVDVNGYQKGPNVYGRDTFEFQLFNSQLLPSGAVNGAAFAPQPTYTFCSKNVAHIYQGLGCMDLVMRGVDY